ncbi:unnamed protein product [Hapterophycus canaliculatus]
MAGHTNEDIEVQLQTQDDIARRIREREAQLSVEARAATTRDLLLPVNDGGDDSEAKCKECKQHFDDDTDMMTCSRCEECWHRECTDDPKCNNIDTWLCPSCSGPEAGSTGGDSDGDISGDDDSGGSGGDASGDEGSGNDNTKSAKTRASRSPHIDLVEAKREEDREIIGANMDTQRELAKKKKEDRPIPDTRYLTRNDVIEAARAIKAKEEIDSVIMQKMEKEDPRLYGITTDPVSGTLVNLRGKKGRVLAARRDVDGYVEYRVELEVKHRKTKGTNKKLNTRPINEPSLF